MLTHSPMLVVRIGLSCRAVLNLASANLSETTATHEATPTAGVFSEEGRSANVFAVLQLKLRPRVCSLRKAWPSCKLARLMQTPGLLH